MGAGEKFEGWNDDVADSQLKWLRIYGGDTIPYSGPLSPADIEALRDIAEVATEVADYYESKEDRP